MRQKSKSRSCEQENIGSALETRQSHTIKHRVTKNIPKRPRERHTVLRHWVLQWLGANECLWATKASLVTPDGIGLLLILNNMHNFATYRRMARLHSKIPPALKPALLTTLSSSLRCESAAEHHTAEQYSKTDRTKFRKDLRRSDRV